MAVCAATKNTTFSGDKIGNSIKCNLGSVQIKQLTSYTNELWDARTVPQEQKPKEIVVIPMPQEKLDLESLQPISLTSCLHKLNEQVELTRPQGYLKGNCLLPKTMFGFHPFCPLKTHSSSSMKKSRPEYHFTKET